MAGNIAAGVVIGLMALRVAFKGFVTEFSSKFGVVVGVLCYVMFVAPLSSFFASKGLGQGSTPVAMILLFIAGYVSTKYLLAVIDEIFDLLHLDVFDHMLGLVLGAVEGAALVAAAMYLMSFQSVFDLTVLLDESDVLSALSDIAPVIVKTISAQVIL